MAKATFQAVIIAALTISGSALLNPAHADQTVIATMPAAPASDDVMQRAIDYIQQSKAARDRQVERDKIKITSPERVVRHRSSDHVYVLGGSAAIPM